MLLQLEEIRKRAAIQFSIQPVLLDQGHPGFNIAPYRIWLQTNGFELTVLDHDTYSTARKSTPVGKSICRLCSCQRRGILYHYAERKGFAKIALGHQMHDFNETMLLNMLYAGTTASMSPKREADNGQSTVIRPLCYVPKTLIEQYARKIRFPIIPDNLCGYAKESSRLKVRTLLQQFHALHPNSANNLFAAQKNLKPDRLPVL